MSRSSDELLAQYQQWFEIALFEHRNIQDRKWKELNSFSEKKQLLAAQIETIETEHPSWKREQSDALHFLIHQLADLEQLNQTLMDERMGEIKIQVQDAGRRKRIIQQLHQKYKSQSGPGNSSPFRKA